MDYEQALERAHDALPDRPSADERRLSIPDPKAHPDGAFTRLTNLGAIADALSREPEHLHRTIQGELGTSGQIEADRARYNGTFDAADFSAAIDSYVAEYVTCSECGLPDTVLSSEDGVDMLRCQACGAFRPVETRAVKSQSHGDRPTLEEGKTYEVKIVGTGRKGDGVAEKGNFTVFVPGAQEGDVVEAYIESINGNLAFARQA